MFFDKVYFINFYDFNLIIFTFRFRLYHSKPNAGVQKHVDKNITFMTNSSQFSHTERGYY